MKKIALITLAAALGFSAAASAADTLSVPKGYEKWAKSKQRIETDKKSLFYGIHYLYVDKKAMPAYKTGGPYPEGSRFVAVNYTIREENGQKVPGKKSMIVLMQKDARQKATGGWHFAAFTADGKPSGLDGRRDCFGCHERDAKERNYVISRYADFK